MKSKYIRLSYSLNPDLSAYGNGSRIIVSRERSLSKGDTSNNTSIALSSHFGTHIDFPLHFIDGGKSLNEYELSEFIYSKVLLVDISSEGFEDSIIGPAIFDVYEPDSEVELIILYTGFSQYRHEEKYWKENLGLSPQLAKLLEQKYPKLRAIGFDLMSLSSFQRRVLGRKSHYEFLSRNILIIEDMDLSVFQQGLIQLKMIIVTPLYVDGAEGAPVTVIAVIDD
jgi:arylformamidase